MRLSDLVSHLSPTELTQIALLLFLGVFIAVAARAWITSRAVHERAAAMPLDDGDVHE
jgi:cbb3-type cytochrome oxidase subunit 3